MTTFVSEGYGSLVAVKNCTRMSVINRKLEVCVFQLQAVFAFAEENYMGVVAYRPNYISQRLVYSSILVECMFVNTVPRDEISHRFLSV